MMLKEDKLPSGKLTRLPMKITIFPGKYHQNGGFSMAMLVYRRVFLCMFHLFSSFPRHQSYSIVIFSADDVGCPSSPPKCIAFRFHETILSFGEPGSLGHRDSSTPRKTNMSPRKSMVGSDVVPIEILPF